MTEQEILASIKDVLNNDEKILLTIKPNKLRMVLVNGVIGKILEILLAIAFFVGAALSSMFIAENDPDLSRVGMMTLTIIAGVFFVISPLFSILVNYVRWRKALYVVTDKKIIIRTGFIGVDIHNLEMKFIGSINVSVNIDDKIMSPNTGSITFGSSSSPLLSTPDLSSFSFSYIDHPYETYKEIKELVDSFNKETK